MKTAFPFSYRSYSGHLIEGVAKLSELKSLFRAARNPRFIHARCRNWCCQDVATIYLRDTSSPSGKLMAASHADCVVSAVLERCKRTSPLSPTEML